MLQFNYFNWYVLSYLLEESEEEEVSYPHLTNVGDEPYLLVIDAQTMLPLDPAYSWELLQAPNGQYFVTRWTGIQVCVRSMCTCWNPSIEPSNSSLGGSGGGDGGWDGGGGGGGLGNLGGAIWGASRVVKRGGCFLRSTGPGTGLQALFSHTIDKLILHLNEAFLLGA